MKTWNGQLDQRMGEVESIVRVAVVNKSGPIQCLVNKSREVL